MASEQALAKDQVRYHSGTVIYVLTHYSLLHNAGRPPARHETLLTSRAPRYEASTAANSRLLADVDLALRQLTPWDFAMVWDAYGNRPDKKNTSRWRDVAEDWDLTNSEARREVAIIVRRLVNELNRPKGEQA